MAEISALVSETRGGEENPQTTDAGGNLISNCQKIVDKFDTTKDVVEQTRPNLPVLLDHQYTNDNSVIVEGSGTSNEYSSEYILSLELPGKDINIKEELPDIVKNGYAIQIQSSLVGYEDDIKPGYRRLVKRKGMFDSVQSKVETSPASKVVRLEEQKNEKKDEPFACGYCAAEFSQEKDLINHLLSHDDEESILDELLEKEKQRKKNGRLKSAQNKSRRKSMRLRGEKAQNCRNAEYRETGHDYSNIESRTKHETNCGSSSLRDQEMNRKEKGNLSEDISGKCDDVLAQNKMKVLHLDFNSVQSTNESRPLREKPVEFNGKTLVIDEAKDLPEEKMGDSELSSNSNTKSRGKRQSNEGKKAEAVLSSNETVSPQHSKRKRIRPQHIIASVNELVTSSRKPEKSNDGSFSSNSINSSIMSTIGKRNAKKRLSDDFVVDGLEHKRKKMKNKDDCAKFKGKNYVMSTKRSGKKASDILEQGTCQASSSHFNEKSPCGLKQKNKVAAFKISSQTEPNSVLSLNSGQKTTISDKDYGKIMIDNDCNVKLNASSKKMTDIGLVKSNSVSNGKEEEDCVDGNMRTKGSVQSVKENKKRNTTRKVALRCVQCRRCFLWKWPFLEHLKIHPVEKPFECLICNKRLLSFFSHQGHMKIFHSREKIHKCRDCDKTFHSSWLLKRHAVMHSSEKPFVCGVCNRAFSRKSVLVSHALCRHTKHNAEQDYRCQPCGKTFKDKRNLDIHLKRHPEAEKPYECHVCSKRFAIQKWLTAHVQRHIPERKFPCEICGKKYFTKGDALMHQRRHTKEPTFECNICDKKFIYRSELKTHTKKHKGIKQPKNIVCKICSKTFATRRDLERHDNVHTGLKPYICPVCQKGFAQEANMHVHLKVHTGERPYICDVCEKGFVVKSKLVRHKETHITAKGLLARPYKCVLCPKKYTAENSLVRHLRKHKNFPETVTEAINKAIEESSQSAGNTPGAVLACMIDHAIADAKMMTRRRKKIMEPSVAQMIDQAIMDSKATSSSTQTPIVIESVNKTHDNAELINKALTQSEDISVIKVESHNTGVDYLQEKEVSSDVLVLLSKSLKKQKQACPKFRQTSVPSVLITDNQVKRTEAQANTYSIMHTAGTKTETIVVEPKQNVISQEQPCSQAPEANTVVLTNPHPVTATNNLRLPGAGLPLGHSSGLHLLQEVSETQIVPSKNQVIVLSGSQHPVPAENSLLPDKVKHIIVPPGVRRNNVQRIAGPSNTVPSTRISKSFVPKMTECQEKFIIVPSSSGASLKENILMLPQAIPPTSQANVVQHILLTIPGKGQSLVSLLSPAQQISDSSKTLPLELSTPSHISQQSTPMLNTASSQLTNVPLPIVNVSLGQDPSVSSTSIIANQESLDEFVPIPSSLNQMIPSAISDLDENSIILHSSSLECIAEQQEDYFPTSISQEEQEHEYILPTSSTKPEGNDKLNCVSYEVIELPPEEESLLDKEEFIVENNHKIFVSAEPSESQNSCGESNSDFLEKDEDQGLFRLFGHKKYITLNLDKSFAGPS